MLVVTAIQISMVVGCPYRRTRIYFWCRVTESQLVWPGQTTKRGLEMYTLVVMDPVYADDLMALPFTHLGTGLRADEALASWK